MKTEQTRNDEIVSGHNAGVKTTSLAKKFKLSTTRIRQIIETARPRSKTTPAAIHPSKTHNAPTPKRLTATALVFGTKRTRDVNGVGIGFAGLNDEHLKDIRVYAEHGSVQVWFTTQDVEHVQYLSPTEAMAFAKAFERCAIAALKESS